MDRLNTAAESFCNTYAYTSGGRPVGVIDPLTVIAIIRLAIMAYECFSGHALLRVLRAKWGIGEWLRRRALSRAVDDTDLGNIGDDQRAALKAELDEFVVDMFRALPDPDAFAVIREAYELCGVPMNQGDA